MEIWIESYMKTLKFVKIRDNILNRIYDFFSGDRTCSNCKHVKEEPHELDKFIAIATHGWHEIRMIKRCSLDNSSISENEVNTRKCRHFKRKYGSAPAIRKIHSSIRRAKRPWQLHKITIGVIVGIISFIVAFVALLHNLGII